MTKCGGENYLAGTEVKVSSIQGSQISRTSLLSEGSQGSLACPSAKNCTWMMMMITMMMIIIITTYLTASGLSHGGSGYYAHT
jgi:hypothetical protein